MTFSVEQSKTKNNMVTWNKPSHVQGAFLFIYSIMILIEVSVISMYEKQHTTVKWGSPVQLRVKVLLKCLVVQSLHQSEDLVQHLSFPIKGTETIPLHA